MTLHPLQEPRRLKQHSCSLDESRCDGVLGPRLCLKLRGARNAAVTTASVGSLLALALVTAAAAAAVARHVQQHWRQQRGWQRVADKAEAPHGALARV